MARMKTRKVPAKHYAEQSARCYLIMLEQNLYGFQSIMNSEFIDGYKYNKELKKEVDEMLDVIRRRLKRVRSNMAGQAPEITRDIIDVESYRAAKAEGRKW